jgi:3-dehydroquinate dehydratase
MPRAVLNINGPDLRPPGTREPQSEARDGVGCIPIADNVFIDTSAAGPDPIEAGGPRTSEAPRPIIHLREEFRHRRPVVRVAVAGFAAA